MGSARVPDLQPAAPDLSKDPDDLFYTVSVCPFFMGSTGFTPQNSHTPFSLLGLDHHAEHPLDGASINLS
jgi:hypothetical protein